MPLSLHCYPGASLGHSQTACSAEKTSPKPEQQFLISKFEILTSYLKCHVDDDYKERVGEVEEQPGLNGLDVRSAGEATGYGEVDGGEDHHAGDVDGDLL